MPVEDADGDVESALAQLRGELARYRREALAQVERAFEELQSETQNRGTPCS